MYGEIITIEEVDEIVEGYDESIYDDSLQSRYGTIYGLIEARDKIELMIEQELEMFKNIILEER